MINELYEFDPLTLLEKDPCILKRLQKAHGRSKEVQALRELKTVAILGGQICKVVIYWKFVKEKFTVESLTVSRAK